MLFETQTSIYDLTSTDDGFTLKKIAIKNGCFSSIAVGSEFTGQRVYIDPFGLYINDIKTSPIVLK